MNPISVRRLGALTAAGLVLTAVTSVAGPAQATTPTPLSNGASWIAAQINATSHLVHDDQYNFDDVGGSIYAAYALQVAGGHSTDVAAMTGAVGTHLVGSNGYIEADEYDYNPPYAFKQVGHYANAAANALVFAEAEGQSTSNWNGVNLVAKVEARIASTTGANGGMIADDSFYGNYANSIGQALAARGLAGASSADAAAALSFLLKQQCSAGYFRLYFDADSDNSWTCDSGISAGKSPADLDTTALVVRQLEPLASGNPTVQTALNNAKTWLLAQQHADGSFGGGPSTPAPNANSTGLAGWALGDLGQTEAASRAAVWVRRHQAQELPGCPTALSTQTGAIAYNDSLLTAGRAHGIPTSAQGEWRLATFQALPVLQWAPTTGGTVTASATTGYVQARWSTKVTVRGLVPGSPLCLTVGATKAIGTAALSGNAGVNVLMPAGTANRVVSVTDGSVTKTVTVKVLGAKTLGIQTSTLRPRVGSSFTIKVFGLAPHETVHVSYGGRAIRTMTASSTGVYSTRIYAGTVGTHALVVTGQFWNRRVAQAITVSR